MRHNVVVVGALRVLLVLLFLALLVGQVMAVPGQFSSLAEADPPLQAFRWPLTIGGVLGLLCVQVVVVCTWRLLSMVRADRIFSSGAFVWVDVMVWAIAAAWAIYMLAAGALTVTAYVTPELRDPGLPMALLGMGLAGSVVVLLVVVLRALLRQATALRTDLDEVI